MTEKILQPFKQCSCCERFWFDRELFLSDDAIDCIGYQVNFDHLELGYFLFNHHTCGSTMAISANCFTDLYDGPIFNERRTGQDECPEFCLHTDNFEKCPAQCICAYVREVLQIVKSWRKSRVI
ncbi:MAG: hypothetical protein ABIK28_19020 [Planctomycetota bacterium]